MKHIKRDVCIVENVGVSGLNEEYVVGVGASLTLIIVARVTNKTTIDPKIRLIGAGASATILGAIYGRDSGIVNIHTLQHHQAINTMSNLLIKTVLTDDSVCTYEGSIVVDKSAQKTNAYQRNENLLLGTHSHATSKPALEIRANDVRCTHGAIVKTLSEDELWYAATRGIGKLAAQYLITLGFLSSVFDTIPDTIIREKLLWKISSWQQK